MKDLFSTQAKTYAKFRPLYPQELYDFIYARVKAFDHAWDCGTGNGQVAKELAKKFTTILATDLSASQLEHATPAPNITYRQSQAEDLRDVHGNTFDLITVGTALHWFDHARFFTEVKRVAKNGAFFAAWCYGNFRSDENVTGMLSEFYSETVGKYWDPERKLVDDAYRTIPFPFEEVEAPPMQIEARWSLEQLEGYLNSWSAVQNYIRANSENPVNAFIEKIRAPWGESKKVVFPLHMRAGHVNSNW